MKRLLKSSSANRRRTCLLCGVAAVFVCALAGLLSGAGGLSLASLFSGMAEGLSSAEGRIFFLVRLPRTLGALTVGAALAVSGDVIQNVLGNRLASPTVLGLGSASGLAVTLCTALSLYHTVFIGAFAFLGALFAIGLVVAISHRARLSRSTVILVGVALNSLFSALSEALGTLFPDTVTLSRAFKLGDLSAVTPRALTFAVPTVLVCLILLFFSQNELSLLTLGEESAAALGMNTRRYRTFFLVLAALLCATAVSVAGLVGFVGLIVPHLVRRLVGSSQRTLGCSALFGGALVCLCDTLARTLFSPFELPVGILLSALGAPFFLFLLLKKKGGKTA